jgi:undecaprenyl diphosphate synthase
MSNLPKHVAIVMDGNGRWGKAKGTSRCAGHTAGVDAIRRVTEVSAKIGIPVLSLFAFSRENWQRAPDEVSHLFQLLEFYLAKETATLVKNGIQLQIIGAREALAISVQHAIAESETCTASGTRMKLVIAVNFSGQWELAQAMENIRKKAPRAAITEELIAAHMPYRELPAPDLFIRTAGERRLSNFFLWDLAYTELHFANVCWPDFGEADLREALLAFKQRKRTFGAVPSSEARNVESARAFSGSLSTPSNLTTRADRLASGNVEASSNANRSSLTRESRPRSELGPGAPRRTRPLVSIKGHRGHWQDEVADDELAR